MSRFISLFLFLFLLTVGLAGCGGAEAEPKSEAVSAVTLTLVGNTMAFEQTEFTVKAGTEETLTFENTATSAAMEHNVVLLADNAAATIDRVGQARVVPAGWGRHQRPVDVASSDECGSRVGEGRVHVVPYPHRVFAHVLVPHPGP